MRVFDDLVEFSVDFLLSGKGNARQLTFHLADGWPDRPALELVFTLSVAANSIEEVFSGAESQEVAYDSWRMAGLVGVDLFMAQSLGVPHRSSADLTAYWRAYDPFFLTS